MTKNLETLYIIAERHEGFMPGVAFVTRDKDAAEAELLRLATCFTATLRPGDTGFESVSDGAVVAFQLCAVQR